MTWSIRARLTVWYSFVMVVVLVTGAIAVAIVQERLAYERLDGELERLMLTLEGVMRTEFGEGLDLIGAADEASIEVVAPDRTLLLLRPNGEVLEVWGRPLEVMWQPSLTDRSLGTVTVGTARLRALSRPVTYRGHQYVAGVMASLDGIEAEHRELLAGARRWRGDRACRRWRRRMACGAAVASTLDGSRRAGGPDYGARSIRTPADAARRRTGSPGAGLQCCARSAGDGASRPAPVHGRCLTRTPNTGVRRPHDSPGDALAAGTAGA